MMEFDDTLEKIKQLMKSKEWTVYKLAKESGIPYSSLNNIFKRAAEPTLATLRKICGGLGITLSEFFSGEDTPIRTEYCKDERELIALYQSLTSYEQKLLTAYALGLAKKLPEID